MLEFNNKERDNIIHVKHRIQNMLHDKMIGMNARLQLIIKFYGILTGGASASLFHGTEPKDLDIFLKHDAARDEFTHMLKDETIHSQIADIDPKYGLETLVNGKMVTSNATTFKNGIQIIMIDTVNARERFDFVHTMPWYDCDSKLYHISREQYDSIINKKLVVNPNANPNTPTKKRISKFLDRGWKQ